MMLPRLSAAIGLSSLVVASALAACVGDSSTPDASTNDAGDATVQDAPADAGGDAATNPDAGDASDAAMVFDGANASCNDLFPSQAPQQATVECSGVALNIDAGGGTIPPGKYYLYDETFLPTSGCGAAGSRPSINDAITIEAADGGGAYIVNAALEGNPSRRLTLGWTLTSATTFNQSDICPGNTSGFTGVAYAVSVSGNTTTITYKLPGFAIETIKSY
jgi:hypothetical protein